MEDSSDEEASPLPPAFSPISGCSSISISTDQSEGGSSDDQCNVVEAVHPLVERKSTDEEQVDVSQVAELSEEPTKLSQKPWNGFKIVGDNIDKNIHRSFQRLQNETISLHHFHSYAVRDRINLSGTSEESLCPSSIDPSALLVIKEEWDNFKEGCSILVSR